VDPNVGDIGFAAAAGEDRGVSDVFALNLPTRGAGGRGGLPRHYVLVMYCAYVSGLSLEQVAGKYGRTRQCVFDVFKGRGLRLRRKEFLPAVVYKGRKYTAQLRSRDRRYTYLRATVGRSKIRYLHRVVWEERHGPVPPGHKVCFRDGDYLNCAPKNLFLLTNDQQQQWRGRKGANQFTTTAASRLKLLVGNFESGAGTLSTELKARAA
jgi:hypothetical protein